jgi:hypothetical protein
MIYQVTVLSAVLLAGMGLTIPAYAGASAANMAPIRQMNSGQVGGTV